MVWLVMRLLLLRLGAVEIQPCVYYSQSFPYNNWFAYHLRMKVAIDLYTLIDPQDEKLLIEAREDGQACHQSKSTFQDLTGLATVCQLLAKHPNTGSSGPDAVDPDTVEYLYEAVDYLVEALDNTDSKSAMAYDLLGKCLYDLGEYRKAVECIKRAMEHETPPNPFTFRLLCVYLLRIYNDSTHNVRTQKLLLKELGCVLEEGVARYRQLDIVQSVGQYLADVSKTTTSEMLSLVNDILERQHRVPGVLRRVIHVGLTYCPKNPNRVIAAQAIELMDKFDDILEDKDVADFTDMYSDKENVHDDMTSRAGFTYDFFVSHSHKDAPWVRHFLLRALEDGDYNDVKFRGRFVLYCKYKL
jgi:tetratricopeptide (TPR) repeat protein